MRFLCLHGYGQSAETFRHRTGSLRKAMKRCEFTFVNAPHKANAEFLLNATQSGQTEADGAKTVGEGMGAGPEPLGWWNSGEDGARPSQSKTYVGFDQSLDCVRKAIEEEGPFDGILGFSQGATLAAIFMLLSTPTAATPPPFRCAILVSGFIPRDASLLGLIESRAASQPPISLPTLHVMGENDTFVSTQATLALATSFANPSYFTHPGGHGIPSNAEFRKSITDFLAKVGEQTVTAGLTA